MDLPETSGRGSRRKIGFGVAAVLLALAGIVLGVWWYVRPGVADVDTSPVANADAPMPRSPQELQADLVTSTANGQRARLIRLLTEEGVAFVNGADAEVRAIAESRRRAILAVRTALGEDSARLVEQLPDLPNPWPLFEGIDWNQAQIRGSMSPTTLTTELVVGERVFQAIRQTDGEWHLQVASGSALDTQQAELAAALAPLRQTYQALEEGATLGRFQPETFPAALSSIRQLATLAAHAPPNSR